MSPGLGRRSHAGHKQTVGVVTVIVENQVGPTLAQGRHQVGHEARRAHAGHIFEAENNIGRRVALGTAHDLRHHVQGGRGDVDVMIHVEPLGPGHGQSRFKYHVPAGHDDFGNGPHVAYIVQKVETTHDLIVIADHFARDAHQITRLGRITQHIGGAHQNLLQGFRRELVPFLRFFERIGHIGHHGHMEMGAAPVFQRKEVA